MLFKKVNRMIRDMNSRDLDKNYRLCCRSIYEGELLLLESKSEQNRRHVSGLIDVIELQRSEYEEVMKSRGIDFEKISEEVRKHVEFHFKRS